MRLFDPTRFNVIVLVIPVAIAMSQSDGCSSTTTERPGPLTAEAIQESIPGNTFKLADGETYAFVGEDGSLRGSNIPSGATQGTWFVSDNGVLCAKWDEPDGGAQVCDTLHFFSAEIGYQWGGNSMVLLEGNPKEL